MTSRRLIVFASLNFFTIGVLTSLLGPAIPDLAAQTGSSIVAVGGVISALFVGAVIAQVVGGPLVDRLGSRPFIIMGLAGVALGMASIALSHALLVVLVSSVLAGLGHGILDISTSVMISTAAGEQNVIVLNLINIFFGLGAVAGPAAASLTLSLWHTTIPVICGGALLAALLVPVAVSFLPRTPAIEITHETHKASRALYRSTFLWVLGAIFLLYVGIENGIGGWIALYIHNTTPADLGIGALVASSFWLAITAGRILATFFGGKLSPKGLLILSLTVVLAGAVLLTASTGSLIMTVVATMLFGLGCGPVFPTALAITTRSFPQIPGQAASTMIALGSLGGIIVPWLQGLILGNGDTRWSVAFVAVLAGAMLTFGNLISRWQPVHIPTAEIQTGE